MKLLRGMGLAALLFTCGCGGAGGGTFSTSGGSSGGNNPGGGGSNPNPTGVNLNFAIAGFGGAQQATLLKRNMPATEQGATATANSSSSNRLLTRAELEGKDMPLELLEQEAVRLRAVAGEATEAGPVRPKFQEIPEGGTVNLFIVTSGLTVTCQKMHADNETVHSSIFAEVVGGNPVIDKAKALDMAAAFDTNNPFNPGLGIYDQDRDLFGSEWTSGGGRDGDAKINLVFLSPTSIGGANFFGFFRPTDEYSKAQFSTSNEGEILYLNASKTVGDGFDVLGTIAHEFEHLIAYNTKLVHQGAFDGTQENAGIDEGKAVLAEDLLGYGLTASGGGSGFVFRVCQGFLANPSRVGLFTFDGGNDCYGRGYTLMRYIVDRFGLPAFQAYAKTSGVGLAQLNASFGGFAPLFGDWQMALLASPLAGPVPSTLQFGPSFNPRGTYNIRGLGVGTLNGLTPSQTVTPPTGVQTANLPAWAIGTVVYRNGTGNTLNLNLQGDSTIGGGVLLENPQGTFSGVR